MKYVAWYTKDTVYEELFYNTLKPSLDKYNLEYIAISVPNYQKWNRNVAQKPAVILQALEELKKPFVLLDADCAFTEEPTLFNQIDKNKYDIGFHTLQWSTWYNRPNDTNTELLTGTMWFNYNDKVIKLVEAWHAYCSNHPGAVQPPFTNLMKNKYKHLKVFPLPIEYCYIHSMPNGKEPFVKVSNPVITHYQASRKTKRVIL